MLKKMKSYIKNIWKIMSFKINNNKVKPLPLITTMKNKNKC